MGDTQRAKSETEARFRRTLGRRLAGERRRRRLTQADIHRRTGLSIEYISRTENGRENPTILTLRDWVRSGLRERVATLLRGIA
ncbi:MAG: helix-turn-helix domain-containing protein [Planctomycetes bacterium]|nr:helix-turn-helix domain-containing protein [Planctomycetota bacterium]